MTIWPAAGRSDRKGQALERRTRPKAKPNPGGGVRGGGSPPATNIHYDNRRGEVLERHTRPKAEATGGGCGRAGVPLLSPSIITTERAKRSSGARGRRPRQGGGRGRAGAPRYHHSLLQSRGRSARAAHEAEGRVNRGGVGGAEAPSLPMISRRSKAGARGGFRGAGAPPTPSSIITTTFYNISLQLFYNYFLQP